MSSGELSHGAAAGAPVCLSENGFRPLDDESRDTNRRCPFAAGLTKETLGTSELKPAVRGALEKIRISSPIAYFLSVWLKYVF